MAKLSWKQAFINAVDAYRRAKGITDKIAVGSFPALLEEAIGSGGGGSSGGGVETCTVTIINNEGMLLHFYYVNPDGELVRYDDKKAAYTVDVIKNSAVILENNGEYSECTNCKQIYSCITLDFITADIYMITGDHAVIELFEFVPTPDFPWG